MKIKLDENLPALLADSVNKLGHDVQTALDEGLQGVADPTLWDAAQHESRFLITQDLDFSDLRQFTPGTHAGILVIRLRAPSRQNLITLIEKIFRSENVDEWRGCFVIATARKTRVIRPPSAG